MWRACRSMISRSRAIAEPSSRSRMS